MFFIQYIIFTGYFDFDNSSFFGKVYLLYKMETTLLLRVEKDEIDLKFQ